MADGFHDGELAVQRRAGVVAEAARLSGMLALARLGGGLNRFLADRTFAVLAGRIAMAACGSRRWRAGRSPRPGLGDHPDHPCRPGARRSAPCPAGGAARRAAGNRLRRAPARADQRQAHRSGQRHAARRGSAGLRQLPAVHPAARPRPGPAGGRTGDRRKGQRRAPGNRPHRRRHRADRRRRHVLHRHRARHRRRDASHRGGSPGFVRVDDGDLWWPDYAGNNMFNTLGNLAADPAARCCSPASAPARPCTCPEPRPSTGPS